MREINLNTATAGMTRLRVKGGASPESLYELYNGYINASKIPQQRPAAQYKFSVPTLSKGLVLHKGIFYTFSAKPVAAVSGSTNLVLIHPVPSYNGTIKQIHFAQPYMGFLYVVAEFNADGTTPQTIYHYWVQVPKKWEQIGIYKANELVIPTTGFTGLYYRASRKDQPNAWQPETSYHQGDIVQPTVYNGWQYGALFVFPGDPTSSSDIEPIWPTTYDAQVYESSSGNQPPDPEPPKQPATHPDEDNYYGNIGGSGGRGQFGNTLVRIR